MPLLTLHFCRLNTFTPVAAFIQELQQHPDVEVIIASRPRNTIIKPSSLDTDPLSKRYDIVLLLRTPNATLPSNLRGHVWYEYKINVGVPGKLLDSYPDRNAKLTNESAEAELTGALEKRGKEVLDPALYEFIGKLTKGYGDKPVTMVNLLRFKDGKAEQYAQYGKELEPIIHKRGGDAKIVGKVVHHKSNGFADPGDDPKGSKAGEWWDEVSLVHYPSISHFGDMLAGEDYQDVNRRLREPVSNVWCVLGDALLLMCWCRRSRIRYLYVRRRRDWTVREGRSSCRMNGFLTIAAYVANA